MIVEASAASGTGFLAGGGRMGAYIRAFDWERTPLGPPASWRPTLKAMVRMALTTGHPIFIWWGPELTCLYNDAYSASLGPEKHPGILGMPARQAWPEIWPIIGPQIEMVLRGEGATWNENQLVPIIRNGRLEDVYWTYSYGPIDDDEAENKVGGVLVICTETTEQLLAERRLEAERAQFASLFEQAPGFMALLRSPEHVFELANPAYLRLIGGRDVIGQRVCEALPETVEQGYVALLDRVYESGEAFAAVGAQVTLPEADGQMTRRYVDFVYQPIKDGSGAVTGIFVEGVDVTDRYLTELKLRDSEARFRLAVESSSLGTFDVHFDTGRVRFSPRARELFDLTEEEPTLDRCFSRIHPADVPHVKVALAAVRARPHDGLYRVQHRIVRGDGSVRWLTVAGRIVHDERDGHERLAGVLWDITEQQELMDALTEADRRKDEFLATLAHELRNPLAPIRTAAHLLARPDLPGERVAWCSELIQRQSRTMALLLDDLMDVSRITTGKLELRRERVRLRTVVDAAVETARPSIDGKRHALEIAGLDDDLVLDADALRLAQVLVNLLTNAAKYSDPGGAIRLDVRRDGDHVELAVTDRGIGIDPRALPGVFEMFRQVKGALDRAEGGLGIGLALTRGLVELHGGTVQATSPGLGLGSTFTVRLPIGTSTAPTESAASSGSTKAVQRRRVLVADDNVDAARTQAMSLELDGYDVALVHDGLAALEEVLASHPDAALLDIGMPGLDGYQLAARIRAEYGEAPILLIAMTGWGQDSDKRRALEAGFDQHFTKPVSPDAISAALAEWFAAR